jgi:hypothetical protein
MDSHKQKLYSQFEEEKEQYIQNLVKEFKEFLKDVWKSFSKHPDQTLRINCISYVADNVRPLRISVKVHPGGKSFTCANTFDYKILKDKPVYNKIENFISQLSKGKNGEIYNVDLFHDILFSMFELSLRGSPDYVFIMSSDYTSSHDTIAKLAFRIASNELTWEFIESENILNRSSPFTGEELLLLEDKLEYLIQKLHDVDDEEDDEIVSKLKVYAKVINRIFATEKYYLNLVLPAQDKMFQCPW